MAPFEAGPGNVLLVGPGEIRDIAIFDAQAVQRLGGGALKRRRCGLVQEDIEEGLFFGVECTHSVSSFNG
jgi:hypothetical protein